MSEDEIAIRTFPKWIDPNDWKIDLDAKSEWSTKGGEDDDDLKTKAPKVYKKGGFNRSQYKRQS